MKKMLFELISHREILFALVKRNIKIRYKQTIMGFLWAIFIPLVIVISGIIVKKAISILSGKPLEFVQIVSMSAKALPWAFFIGAIRAAVGSLVANIFLIKKIYFPREIFPISYILTQLFDFFIALVVLTIIFIFAKIGISIYLLWAPLLIFFLIFLATGLGFVLSCSNLFFRDVKYIVDVILNFGIFFTPVFFEASMFGRWKPLLLLNPVAAILENINNVVVLHKPPDLLWLIYAGVLAVFFLLGGWLIFKKAEPVFADRV
jgi:ABC-type polysaccharide/polyol phosphate export permease